MRVALLLVCACSSPAVVPRPEPLAPARVAAPLPAWSTARWSDELCEPGGAMRLITKSCLRPGLGARERFDRAVDHLWAIAIDGEGRPAARAAVEQAAVDILCSEHPTPRDVSDAFYELGGDHGLVLPPPVKQAALAADQLDLLAKLGPQELPKVGQLLHSEIRWSVADDKTPPRCAERLRTTVAELAASHCVRGPRTFIDPTPGCSYFATLGCGIAEDDAVALSRAGNHYAAGQRFEQLAFSPAFGCTPRKELGYAAAGEAYAAGDFERQKRLFEQTVKELGAPDPILRAPPHQMRRLQRP